MTADAPSRVALEVLPIYPDDDAPVREGYKVQLPDTGRFAFFPDTTYGSTEAAYGAALDWATLRPLDAADTRNVVRIAIDPKEEERIGRDGQTRTVLARRATHGWQVRMRRQGESHSQFFNDNHFGGTEGALRAAQYWRDLRDAELTRVDPKTAADRSRATRSQFGVPGLRVLMLDIGEGRMAPYLQGSWSETAPSGKPRRKRKTFSLVKHDVDEVTARLCRMLVRARGVDAIPSTETIPADRAYPAEVQAEALAFRAALEASPPEAGALASGDLDAWTATFAEVYHRARRGVADRLAEEGVTALVRGEA